ncbi:hypothetical protein SLEP1_g17196 [Rubroshorea leprosula]|uniref:Uncharacterized protein n=1 Tax=Rubroshorea leprosula TaxID=152421 RepID=A0AAV5J3X6_9ROSI|nr:hypothetical protein SLEP1_g17196 [Rubroshorea leprosula]
MDSYMVKCDSSLVKTPLRYSSMEKVLTNKGLRRSPTASISLPSFTIAKSTGKLRRTRTKTSFKGQKLKHITLHVASAIKGFIKEKNGTSH